jgi:hypothetical protein
MIKTFMGSKYPAYLNRLLQEPLVDPKNYLYDWADWTLSERAPSGPTLHDPMIPSGFDRTIIRIRSSKKSKFYEFQS